jgi:hypothetical protein
MIFEATLEIFIIRSKLFVFDMILKATLEIFIIRSKLFVFDMILKATLEIFIIRSEILKQTQRFTGSSRGLTVSHFSFGKMVKLVGENLF